MKQELKQLVSELGEEGALKVLQMEADRVRASKSGVITILANSGVHPVGVEDIRGELFVVTEGMLDLSTPEAVTRCFEDALSELARHLKLRQWKEIYVIPTGPTTLCMAIKLLVYRVTGIDTRDLFFDSRIGRYPLDLNIRRIISEA